MSRTRVEIPSGVESSAADGGGESVTADGPGDVGVEVAIKPKDRQTTFEQVMEQKHVRAESASQGFLTEPGTTKLHRKTCRQLWILSALKLTKEERHDTLV